MRVRSLRAWSLGLGASLLAIAACGARSSLLVGDGPGEVDAGADVISVKPPEDAAPPKDAAPPEDAASPKDTGPDVYVADCAEAGVTYIYVVTSENELLRFDPPGGTFATIGTLACPNGNSASPYSMAVDRKGAAYVLFNDGQLNRVSTVTAACKATSFVPEQQGFHLFGMGFATKQNGPEEALFVAESNFVGEASKGLGAIDETTFELGFITPFSKPLGNAVELTGTGDGRLFGLFIDSNQGDCHIAEVDKETGAILSDKVLNFGATPSSFAFAFWGGDFYVFHAEGQGPTAVTRYRPSDDSLAQVASLPTHVVGVGVSTCAPQD